MSRPRYGILPLSHSVMVDFGFDYTSEAGANYATDSTTSGPIAGFPTIWEIDKVVRITKTLRHRPALLFLTTGPAFLAIGHHSRTRALLLHQAYKPVVHVNCRPPYRHGGMTDFDSR